MLSAQRQAMAGAVPDMRLVTIEPQGRVRPHEIQQLIFGNRREQRPLQALQLRVQGRHFVFGDGIDTTQITGARLANKMQVFHIFGQLVFDHIAHRQALAPRGLGDRFDTTPDPVTRQQQQAPRALGKLQRHGIGSRLGNLRIGRKSADKLPVQQYRSPAQIAPALDTRDTASPLPLHQAQQEQTFLAALLRLLFTRCFSHNYLFSLEFASALPASYSSSSRICTASKLRRCRCTTLATPAASSSCSVDSQYCW